MEYESAWLSMGRIGKTRGSPVTHTTCWTATHHCNYWCCVTRIWVGIKWDNLGLPEGLSHSVVTLKKLGSV